MHIHILKHGRPYCEGLVGVPRQWPEGHKWVGFDSVDVETANCFGCRAVHERAKRKEGSTSPRWDGHIKVGGTCVHWCPECSHELAIGAKAISLEEFDERLERILNGCSGAGLLAIPGLYEVVSEHFNNNIIEAYEAEEISDGNP